MLARYNTGDLGGGANILLVVGGKGVRIKRALPSKRLLAKMGEQGGVNKFSIWARSLGNLGEFRGMTKFLDNKICTFKILLSWRFPRKQRFGRFSSLPPMPPPPLKTANLIFIVSPSLNLGEFLDLGTQRVAENSGI